MTPDFSTQLDTLRRFCQHMPHDLTDLVHARYIAGRGQYGDAWAGRDNLAEAEQEIADAIAYIFMHSMTGHDAPTPPVTQLIEAWQCLKEALEQ